MNSVSSSNTRGWSVFLGIVLILAGLISIAAPLFAGIAASVFFGWLILVAGLAHLAYAWYQRGAGAVLWQVLVGIAYLAAGLYMLYAPLAGLAVLTFVLAVYIAAEGVFELAAFSKLRRFRASKWFLVDGIISLALAGLIFFHWPTSSFWFLGTLVGISLLFSGVARLVLSMRPVPSIRAAEPGSHTQRAA
jgi:uncharacterized membrane protein HdeD (DUF308 family)